MNLMGTDPLSAGRAASVCSVGYTLIDLFAGCGAMTRGFVDAGFEPVFAVESNRGAAATYATNFGDRHLHVGPIQDVSVFPVCDVVIGGPPCQGFSPLNRQRDANLSRDLWKEYLRALKLARPAYFVMENVPELLASVEYASLLRAARTLGYRVRGEVLLAADFGVPQRRRRAIVVGALDGDPPWPEQTHAHPDRLHGELLPWRTVRDAFKGLKLKPDGRRWHRDRNPTPTSIVRYKSVPPDGGNRRQMQASLDAAGLGHLVPRCWREHSTGSGDVFGRLWWDRPSPTIRTEFYKPEKGRYLHPIKDRAITVREAARLQTIPDDFDLPEGQAMTAIARQIGNAVPPLLAMRVAEVVRAALDARSGDVDPPITDRAAA